MWISIIIGAIIVILGIYALVTSIKKEVNDGCYACSSKDSCSKKSCPSSPGIDPVSFDKVTKNNKSN